MNRPLIIRIVLLVGLLAALAACGSPDEGASPTLTPIGTAEPTAFATLPPATTPGATAMAVTATATPLRPTATALPTASPTPEPTAAATLEPATHALRGQQVVWFTRDDALWRSDVHGLEMEQLTSDDFLGWDDEPGIRVMPRLSPDGRWIAYAPDRGGLIITDLGTRREHALPVSWVYDLAWSPDSRFLAYAGPMAPMGECAICLYDVVAEESTTLVERLNGDIARVFHLVWSPDGTRLAYACCFVERQPADGSYDGQIQVVTVATGARETIGDARLSVAGAPEVICWTEGGEVTTEQGPGHKCSSTFPIDLFTDVSVDNLLATWEGIFTDDGTWENTRLTVTNRATGELLWERILPPAPLRLAWSPDGRYLLFDDEADDSPIWRVAADNSELKEIIADGYLLGVVNRWQSFVPSLTISPDGKWRVTSSISDPVPVAAGEAEQFQTGEKYHVELTVSATDGSVTWTAVDEWRSWGLGYTVPAPLQWSQDGRSLYFSNVPVPDGCSAFVNGGDLWRLDLADGSVTEIVPYVGLVLALSPDATQLAYYGSFGRGFILRDLATGSEQTIPLPEWSTDWDIGGLQWSPNDEQLLLTQVLDPCSPEPATAVVLVDVEALAAVTVVEQDERNFTILHWLRDDEVRLLDGEGRIWYLEVFSGEMAGGFDSE